MEARWAASEAARQQILRQKAAYDLCVTIGEGGAAGMMRILARRVLDPEVFLTTTITEDGTVESPFLYAMKGAPELALEMLAAGADPRRAAEGGSTLLYNVLLNYFYALADPAKEGGDYIRLFEAILQAGADPTAPMTQGAILVAARHRYSMPAFLLKWGRVGKPFLRALLGSPEFDGRVWPHPLGPPLPAEALAADLWTLEALRRWRRWSPERREWLGAAIRAPRR